LRKSRENEIVDEVERLSLRVRREFGAIDETPENLKMTRGFSEEQDDDDAI